MMLYLDPYSPKSQQTSHMVLINHIHSQQEQYQSYFRIVKLEKLYVFLLQKTSLDHVSSDVYQKLITTICYSLYACLNVPFLKIFLCLKQD